MISLVLSFIQRAYSWGNSWCWFRSFPHSLPTPNTQSTLVSHAEQDSLPAVIDLINFIQLFSCGFSNTQVSPIHSVIPSNTWKIIECNFHNVNINTNLLAEICFAPLEYDPHKFDEVSRPNQMLRGRAEPLHLGATLPLMAWCVRWKAHYALSQFEPKLTNCWAHFLPHTIHLMKPLRSPSNPTSSRL